MPQIQLLPQNPSFGSQLGQNIGQGASHGISKALGEFQKNKESEKALSGLERLLKGTGVELSDQDKDVFIKSGLKPEVAAHLVGQFAKSRQQEQIAQQKQQSELMEKEKSQQQGQKIFDTAAKMLKQGVAGIGISPGTAIGVNREGVQNRAVFDTLRSKFESQLLPLVNKGALAKQRFDYIMSLIPKSSESQRAIAGKLYALGHELGFDTGVIEEIPWFKKELDKSSGEQNIQSNKQIKEKPSLKEIFG